jgi:hypothetical protein
MKLRIVEETPSGLAVINNKRTEHEVLTHVTMLSTTNPSEPPCVIPGLRIRLKCVSPGCVHGQNLRPHTTHSEYTLKSVVILILYLL